MFNCSVTNQYSLTYIAVGPLQMAPHQTFVCSRSFGQFIVRPRASGEFAWHMPDALNGWVDPISLFIEDNNHRFATTKDMIKTLHKQDRCLHLEKGLRSRIEGTVRELRLTNEWQFWERTPMQPILQSQSQNIKAIIWLPPMIETNTKWLKRRLHSRRRSLTSRMRRYDLNVAVKLPLVPYVISTPAPWSLHLTQLNQTRSNLDFLSDIWPFSSSSISVTNSRQALDKEK